VESSFVASTNNSLRISLPTVVGLSDVRKGCFAGFIFLPQRFKPLLPSKHEYRNVRRRISRIRISLATFFERPFRMRSPRVVPWDR
jgi:hypothetical protein